MSPIATATAEGIRIPISPGPSNWSEMRAIARKPKGVGSAAPATARHISAQPGRRVLIVVKTSSYQNILLVEMNKAEAKSRAVMTKANVIDQDSTEPKRFRGE